MSGLWFAVSVLLVGQAPTTLSVEQAVKLANARDAHAAALEERAHEEEALGGLGTALPPAQFRVGGLSGRQIVGPAFGLTPQTSPLDGAQLTLRVRTPSLASFSAEQAAVHQRVIRRRAIAEVERTEVAYSIRRLHTEARRLAAQAAIAERRAGITAARLALVEERAAAGVVTRDEVDALRLRALQQRSALRKQQAAREEALARLALAVGKGAAPIELVSPEGTLCRALLDDEQAPPVEEVAEVRAWQASAAEAGASQADGWLRLLPWPDFFQLRYNIGATRADDDVSLTVAFNLPVGELGAGRARAARSRARWMGMEARAAADRHSAARAAARVNARRVVADLAALDEEQATVDAIAARLADPNARRTLAPEAALKLEEALLSHQEATADVRARCEQVAWDGIRLGLILDDGTRAASAPEQ